MSATLRERLAVWRRLEGREARLPAEVYQADLERAERLTEFARHPGYADWSAEVLEMIETEQARMMAMPLWKFLIFGAYECRPKIAAWRAMLRRVPNAIARGLEAEEKLGKLRERSGK